MSSRKKSNLISFSSIRGGPGKSTIALALGIFLVNLEKKVLLIDFDINGPFLDLVFNVKPIYTITHYLIRKDIDMDSQIVTGKKFASNMKYLINSFNIENGKIDVIFADRDLNNMKTCLNILATNEGLQLTAELFNDISVSFDYDFIIIDNSPGILDTNLITNYQSNFVFFVIRKRDEEIKDLQYWLKFFKKAFKKSTNFRDWGVILNQSFPNSEIPTGGIEEKIICEIPFISDFREKNINEFNFLIKNQEHEFFKYIELISQSIFNRLKNYLCANCSNVISEISHSRKIYQFYCPNCRAWVKAKKYID